MNASLEAGSLAEVLRRVGPEAVRTRIVLRGEDGVVGHVVLDRGNVLGAQANNVAPGLPAFAHLLRGEVSICGYDVSREPPSDGEESSLGTLAELTGQESKLFPAAHDRTQVGPFPPGAKRISVPPPPMANTHGASDDWGAEPPKTLVGVPEVESRDATSILRLPSLPSAPAEIEKTISTVRRLADEVETALTGQADKTQEALANLQFALDDLRSRVDELATGRRAILDSDTVARLARQLDKQRPRYEWPLLVIVVILQVASLLVIAAMTGVFR